MSGEKSREQKERSERDARNQEHAGGSYRIPDPEDIGIEEELSGLPWGGANMRYVVAKGHEVEGMHHARSISNQIVDDQQYLTVFGSSYHEVQPTGWDGREHGRAADERYSFGGSPFYYPDYGGYDSPTVEPFGVVESRPSMVTKLIANDVATPSDTRTPSVELVHRELANHVQATVSPASHLGEGINSLYFSYSPPCLCYTRSIRRKSACIPR